MELKELLEIEGRIDTAVRKVEKRVEYSPPPTEEEREVGITREKERVTRKLRKMDENILPIRFATASLSYEEGTLYSHLASWKNLGFKIELTETLITIINHIVFEESLSGKEGVLTTINKLIELGWISILEDNEKKFIEVDLKPWLKDGVVEEYVDMYAYSY